MRGREDRMSAHPIVSVIVTTKNRSALLQQALDSVMRARDSRYDLQLIVVNDGSTDDTESVLSRYPVTVIRTEGIGMARARNLGLAAATGDFVTLLDDDDIWLPDNIVHHLEMFERHPEYAAVHGQSQLAHADATPFGDPVPAGPLSSGMIFESLLGYMPQVATVLTRLSAAREAGDMDVTLTGDTDWDWLLRIAWRHPIGRFEKPVMLFRQRDGMNLELAWRRAPATFRVFRRHARRLPPLQRLRAARVLLRHRGHWASGFFDHALDCWRRGESAEALKAFSFAARTSPAHTAVLAARRLGRRS